MSRIASGRICRMMRSFILELSSAKIHKQANADIRDLQVVDQLSLMFRQQMFAAFQLNNYGILDGDIRDKQGFVA